LAAVLILAACGGKSADGSGGGGNVSAPSALKAFGQTKEAEGQTVPDTEAIAAAAQGLSKSAAVQLTQKNASPATDFTYDVTATPNGLGIVVKKYTGPGGVVIVPEKIGDNPVVELGEESLRQSRDKPIFAVVVPAGIVTIGKGAFQGNNQMAAIYTYRKALRLLASKHSLDVPR
jgi:hypothetical protein